MLGATRHHRAGEAKGQRSHWFATALLLLAVAYPVVLNFRVLRPDSRLEFYLSPSRLIADAEHEWNPTEDLGRRTGAEAAYLPTAVLFKLLRTLGASTLLSQQLWTWSILGLAAVGMQRLFAALWPHAPPFASIAAGFMYAFSPFVAVNLSASVGVLLIAYGATPVLALSLLNVARSSSVIRLLIVAGLAGVVAPGVNLATTAVMWIGALVVCVLSGNNVRKAATSLAFALLSGAAASAWWLVPAVRAIGSGGAEIFLQTDPLEILASQSSFFEVFRLAGLWALYYSQGNTPYLAVQGILLSPAIVSVTALAPILWMLNFARTRLARGGNLASLGLVVIAAPMAVSIFPPMSPSLTGTIYRWLFEHLPPFQAFRGNYKWVALIALAYSITLPAMTWRQSRSRQVLMTSLLIVLATAWATPLLLGQVYGERQAVGTVPRYWSDLSRWLESQADTSRVLFVPEQPFAAFTWGSPGGDIAPLLTNRDTVTPRIAAGTNSEGRNLMAMVDRAVDDPSVDFSALLAALRVGLVVHRGDIDATRYGSRDPAQSLAYLRSVDALKEVRQFGPLTVFRFAGPLAPPIGISRAAQVAVANDLTSALSLFEQGSFAIFDVAGARPSLAQRDQAADQLRKVFDLRGSPGSSGRLWTDEWPTGQLLDVRARASVSTSTPTAMLQTYLRIRDATIVSSDRAGDSTTFDVMRAFDGDPSTGWLPSADYANLTVTFTPPLRIRRLSILPYSVGGGVDSAEVDLSVNGRSFGTLSSSSGSGPLSDLGVVSTLQLLIRHGAGQSGISEIQWVGLERVRDASVLTPEATSPDLPLLIRMDFEDPMTVEELDHIAFDGAPYVLRGSATWPGGRGTLAFESHLVLPDSVSTSATDLSASVEGVAYDRPSPTRVEVPSLPAGARFLLLSETDDERWAAYDQSGKRLLKLDGVLGYAQGWVLSTDTKSVSLRFVGARPATQRLGLSAVLLILTAVSYHLWRRRGRRRE